MVRFTACCIITAYNSAAHLSDFARWLDLSYDLFSQFIIVDDHSCDGSYELIEELVGRVDVDSKINLLQLPENSGRPALPRNYGLDRASADWVMFLDIDDIVPIEYIAWVRSQEPKSVYTGTKLPLEDLSSFSLTQRCDTSDVARIPNWAFQFKNLVTLSGSFVPTEVVAHHRFRAEVLEDWKFWRQIAEQTDLSFMRLSAIPIPYYCKQTLSPVKSEQLKRVAKEIGWIRLPFYLLGVLYLKYFEKRLSLAYKHM